MYGVAKKKKGTGSTLRSYFAFKCSFIPGITFSSKSNFKSKPPVSLILIEPK